MLAEFKQALETFDGTDLPIAFADVVFCFPSDTLYPNLCIKDPKYGLISPLKGRTVATIAEIDLALRQKATITYIEAYVGTVSPDEYVFRDYLKHLIDARNLAKKEGNELLQQLYKLFVNTLYGKVAQGINPKTGFDINFDGVNHTDMKPSAITQPYFASMITGTLRAGLSSMLVAIDELNKGGHDYKVISATTDGMLYGVSSKTNVNFKDCIKPDYQGNIDEALKSEKNIFKSFAETDPVLYNKLKEFPALRLLEASRKAWGYDDYLEIKHACNRVINIKTRGQIGYYHDAS